MNGKENRSFCVFSCDISQSGAPVDTEVVSCIGGYSKRKHAIVEYNHSHLIECIHLIISKKQLGKDGFGGLKRRTDLLLTANAVVKTQS